METIIKQITKENFNQVINQAASIIKRGGLVIFPTETVYGLGANALDEQASQKIYNAKGRPSDNPLIVHISNMDQLPQVAKNINENAKKIAENFWPGPISIIMEKTDIVPLKTTGGLNTVAIRMPSNEIARALIEVSKLPIAAPSANISGRPSITSKDYLKEEFDGKVDMIILEEDCEIGIESTVVDCTEDIPKILRPGIITKVDLSKVIEKSVNYDTNIVDKDVAPKSPGMKYRHYSPQAKVVVVRGTKEERIQKTKENLKKDKENNIKSTVICRQEEKENYPDTMVTGNTSKETAKNIFKILRQLDKEKYDKAYFQEYLDNEIDFSIMDRIIKAASHEVI